MLLKIKKEFNYGGNKYKEGDLIDVESRVASVLMSLKPDCVSCIIKVKAVKEEPKKEGLVSKVVKAVKKVAKKKRSKK